VPKKKVRKKKEEVEKTEDKQRENRPKRKVFQYDGKLLFAANQLAVKLFHLNPMKESEKVMLKTKKLLEEIWRCSRRYIRVTEEMANDGGERPSGGSLGGVRPLSKREGSQFLRPARTGWGPCESREEVR
jgi:hypothetical protein